MLKVVVFTCGGLGFEVAWRLAETNGIRVEAVITSPYARKPMGLLAKIRHVVRMQGLAGLAHVLMGKLRTAGSRNDHRGPISKPLPPGVRHLHFKNFHDQDCLEALSALAPDLGVVAGTYILKESVYDLPRLGSINLHTGKVPEYRGGPPVFWELFNGASEVGVTVHRVTARLDGGAVLLQECFPLDAAPEGDPLAYAKDYWRDVLRPNGVRLLVKAVTDIAQGKADWTPQDPSRGKTYRLPDYRVTRELLRRVGERRNHQAPA